MAGWDDFDGDASLKNGFDVALHLGTLAGSLWYFRRAVSRYIVAGLFLSGSSASEKVATGSPSGDSPENHATAGSHATDRKTAWLLVATTIPVALVGVIWSSWLESASDTIWLICVCLIVFGVLLWWADSRADSTTGSTTGSTASRVADRVATAPEDATPANFSIATATWMGLAQVLALWPGVSRSGITMTAARFLNLSRQDAAYFSFLMGLPAIAGAGVYKFIDIGGWSGIPQDYQAGFVWGVATAALSSWIAIWCFMKLIQRWTLTPFVIERILLAILALAILSSPLR